MCSSVVAGTTSAPVVLFVISIRPPSHRRLPRRLQSFPQPLCTYQPPCPPPPAPLQSPSTSLRLRHGNSWTSSQITTSPRTIPTMDLRCLIPLQISHSTGRNMASKLLCRWASSRAWLLRSSPLNPPKPRFVSPPPRPPRRLDVLLWNCVADSSQPSRSTPTHRLSVSVHHCLSIDL